MSTTPVQSTVVPVKSGYMSNPSDVDNLMNGSDETENDIGESEKGLSEAIIRRRWTEKDVGGAMERRGGAKTDFSEAMKPKRGAKTDFGEAMKSRNGAEADVSETMKRSGVEKGGVIAEKKEQVTVTKATDKYAEFRSFVKNNDLAKEMKDLGTTQGLITYINQSLHKWKRQEMKIVITGNSGAGKSSLINALRKLKPSENGAAEVGVVETTTKCQKYTYTETKFVALWDLPGIGTQTFARDKYLNDMKFSQFDVVILVTSTRFLENDIWLARQICALEKHVLFVRTKIDIDMINAERDYPKGFEKETYTSKIRADITENVSKGGLKQTNVEIYLVSSAETDSYDFKQLNEKLKGLLNMRAKAVSAILKEDVQTAIKEKQSSNKKEFKWHKIGSAIFGFLLTSNVDNLNVSSIHKSCLEKFCLDTKSLDIISKHLGEQKKSLRKNPKSYGMILNSIEKSKGETLMETTEEEEYPTTIWKKLKYNFPVIGNFYSAHKNFCTLEKCLEKICDAAAEDELELVTKILHKLERDLHIDI